MEGRPSSLSYLGPLLSRVSLKSVFDTLLSDPFDLGFHPLKRLTNHNGSVFIRLPRDLTLMLDM